MNPIASIPFPGTTAPAQGFGPGAAAPESDAAMAFLEIFAAFMPQTSPEISALPASADEAILPPVILSAAPAESEMPETISGTAPMQEMTDRATHLVIPAGAANIALPAANVPPETAAAAKPVLGTAGLSETASGKEGAAVEDDDGQPHEGEAAAEAQTPPCLPLPPAPAPDAAPQAPLAAVLVIAPQASAAADEAADTGAAKNTAAAQPRMDATPKTPAASFPQTARMASAEPAKSETVDLAAPPADPAAKTEPRSGDAQAASAKLRKPASPAIPSPKLAQATLAGSAPGAFPSAESNPPARNAVAAPNQASAISRAARPILVQSPAMQVAVQLHKAAENGPTNIHMKLVPEDLGTIDISLSIDEGRRVETTIIADRPQTLALLRRDAFLLEKALDTAGLKPEQGSLHFSLRNSGDNAQNQAFQNFQHIPHHRISASDVSAAATETPEIPVYEHNGILNIMA